MAITIKISDKKDDILKMGRIPVKVQLTVLSISSINNYSETATVNFQLHILYRKSDALDYDFIPENGDFPYIILNNCGDINVNNSVKEEFYVKDFINLNRAFGKRDYNIIDKPNECIVVLECHHIICDLKLINYQKLIPFNSVYLTINIGVTGYKNTNLITYVNMNDTSFGSKPVSKELDTFLNTPYWEKSTSVNVGSIYTFNCLTAEELAVVNSEADDSAIPRWSRLYYLMKYDFSPYEDIVKFFLIPTLFNNMLVLYSSMDRADFNGLFTTFCLTDIALLFTMPETKCLTISEASVMSDVIVSIAIAGRKWFSNSELSGYWHLLPLISKTVILVGGWCYSYKKKFSEYRFLNRWFTD